MHVARTGMIACVALFGCSTQATPVPLDASCPPTPASATGDLPCDVAAVLAARCWPCHQSPPKNHAPFPLLTWEETRLPLGTTGLEKWQRMAQVIEPGNFPHMPPNDHPQLSPDDFVTLRAWFAACAPSVPESTGCDGIDGGTVAPPDASTD